MAKILLITNEKDNSLEAYGPFGDDEQSVSEDGLPMHRVQAAALFITRRRSDVMAQMVHMDGVKAFEDVLKRLEARPKAPTEWTMDLATRVRDAFGEGSLIFEEGSAEKLYRTVGAELANGKASLAEQIQSMYDSERETWEFEKLDADVKQGPVTAKTVADQANEEMAVTRARLLAIGFEVK